MQTWQWQLKLFYSSSLSHEMPRKLAWKLNLLNHLYTEKDSYWWFSSYGFEISVDWNQKRSSVCQMSCLQRQRLTAPEGFYHAYRKWADLIDWKQIINFGSERWSRWANIAGDRTAGHRYRDRQSEKEHPLLITSLVRCWRLHRNDDEWRKISDD